MIPVSRVGAFVALALLLSGASPGGSLPLQESHREAFGDLRATLFETSLAKLYPGGVVKWDPNLLLQASDGVSRPVEFAGLVFRPSKEGGLEGATGVEVGNEKEKHLLLRRTFKSAAVARFHTQLVAFKADIKGRIRDFRQFPFAPSEDLTEIKILQIQSWQSGSWPTLGVRYVSHYADPASFTSVEWQSLFDANSGNFVSRLPIGLVQQDNRGHEQTVIFSLQRPSPGELAVRDTFSGRAITYPCSDPCVMDGPTLLLKWHEQE
jgi:hypothetical protein